MDKEQKNLLENISKIIERTAIAQERLVEIIEKQQPSKFAQLLAMFAAGAAVLGALSAVDIIRGWIWGG